MKIIDKYLLLAFCLGLPTLNIHSQTTRQQPARISMTPNQRAEAQQKQIKEVLERVYLYLDRTTPARIVDRETDKAIDNYNQIDERSVLERGDFGITAYEWGVTYSGMLRVAEITGDTRYKDYTRTRLQLVGESYPFFRKVQEEKGVSGLRGLITPRWLDDCGSMGAAMMKASLREPKLANTLRPVIDNAFDFVMYREYRLKDGILARMRPTDNSVWLDDMYMGITPIAYMAKLIEQEDPAKAASLYNEVVRQIELFQEYLWVPEMNLFRHGWIDGMVYGPVAQQGWNGVTKKVNEMGQVEDTCVGTGLGFEHGFYYKRPVSVYAAHGYGPVLLAGAEMIRLSKKSIL